MGTAEEQFANRVGVAGAPHIDGLKEGDDEMPAAAHIDEVEEGPVYATEAPETESIDPEAAAAMSSSSVTLEDGQVADVVEGDEKGDGEVVDTIPAEDPESNDPDEGQGGEG